MLTRPILTYRAEICGQDFITNIDLPKQKWEKTPFEKIHNKACRNILGTRRNGSGLAAKAELGRFPTLLYIAQAMIKYYAKFVSQPTNLIHFALTSETELHDNGFKSWDRIGKKNITHNKY